MIVTAWHDLRDFVEIYKEWTGKEANYKDYMPWNSYYVVAKEGVDIIGIVQMLHIADPYWHRSWMLIENVYVREAYRRQGVAKKMMEHVEVEAMGFHCEFIKLTSAYDKEEAHALYKSLGYVEGYSFKKKIVLPVGF